MQKSQVGRVSLLGRVSPLSRSSAKAIALAVILAALWASERVVERTASAQKKAPVFQVDPMWPKMPKQWILEP